MKTEEKLQVYVTVQGKTYSISTWPECSSRCWTLSIDGNTTASSSFIWRKFVENDKEILYSITVEDNIYAIKPPKFDSYEEWSDWLDDLDSWWWLYKANS